MITLADPSPATQRPATRREINKQDRRQAILDAARASFMDKGYAGTSMSGLLATLGGSKATLWGHFRSKEELFAAVLDDATASYRRELAQCLQPSRSLADGLTGFCRSFLHRILSPDALALWRLVVAESGRFPPVGAIFHERAAQATERALSDFLSEHMDMGDLRRDDPARAARVVISLCTGHQHRLLWGVEQPAPGQIEVEAIAATSVFMRAYAPDGGRSEPTISRARGERPVVGEV